jgi:hypothetical protein
VVVINGNIDGARTLKSDGKQRNREWSERWREEGGDSKSFLSSNSFNCPTFIPFRLGRNTYPEYLFLWSFRGLPFSPDFLSSLMKPGGGRYDSCLSLLPSGLSQLKLGLKRRPQFFTCLKLTFGKTTAIGSGRSLASNSVNSTTRRPYVVNSPPRNLQRQK